MEKSNALMHLELNRFTETTEQMNQFTQAFSAIRALGDPEDIMELCCGFEDNTYNSESMFELIHCVESYLPLCGEEIYVRNLFKSLEESEVFGHNWMKTMLQRVLNSTPCSHYATQVLEEVDKESRQALQILLEEIISENPDLFQEKGQAILTELENFKEG